MTANVRSGWMMAALAVGLMACGKSAPSEAGGAGSASPGATGSARGAAAGAGATIKATQVSVGAGMACALMAGGTVRCWGRSDAGELGAGRVEGQAATPVVVAGVTGATQIAVGGGSTQSGSLACALDGKKVWCWGYAGLFPAPRPADAPRPSEIPGLAGATQLVFGGGQGLALMPDGTVKGWGGNTFNALGQGKDTRVADDALVVIPGISDAIAVASGQNHGCAVHRDGSVTCWGYSGANLDPTKVAGLTDVVAISATAGSDQTCAITKAKRAVCWSAYDIAQGKSSEVAGLDDVTALTAYSHLCARKGDGTAWCWGANDSGQLGIGSAGRSQGKPQQVTGLTDVAQVSAGPGSTCAVRTSGQVLCWGDNRFGQLGDATLVDRAAPVEVKHLGATTPPAPADGLAEVQQPAATAQAFDGLPAGCSHGPLDLQLGARSGPFDVVSAYATDEGGKGITYKVMLANYTIDPAKPYWAERGAQLRVSLRFAKVDLKASKAPLPVVPGVYSMKTDQDQLVAASVANRTSDNIWLASLSLEGVQAGEVELTHVGDGWLCGQARVVAKDAHVTGPFAAKLIAP